MNAGAYWTNQSDYDAQHGTQAEQAAKQVSARATVELHDDGTPKLWKLERLDPLGRLDSHHKPQRIVHPNSVRTTRAEIERLQTREFEMANIVWDIVRA